MQNKVQCWNIGNPAGQNTWLDQARYRKILINLNIRIIRCHTLVKKYLIKQPAKIIGLLLTALVLSGCTKGLSIDDSKRAVGEDSRVQWVVVHYTAADFERSMHLLTQTEVSSHYLLDGEKIYRLVDESRRAWHAGRSHWQGRSWLNASTIGIEMVHPGYQDIAGSRHWYPWQEEQIETLIPLLQDILQRHKLPVNSVIGHADIAPQRKLDPGPLFPWFRLAREGLIHWPLDEHIQERIPVYMQDLPEPGWFQQQLTMLGYEVEHTGVLDEQTRNVLAVFQMKYRPRLFNGQQDAEIAAMLWSLVQQKMETNDAE